MSSTTYRLVRFALLALVAADVTTGSALSAQVRSVDPSSYQSRAQAAGSAQPETMGDQLDPSSPPLPAPGRETTPTPSANVTAPPAVAASKAPDSQTYQEDDVLGAAENVFGRGAEGLAKIVERILKDQGRPTAYIAGREASAAFAVGLRYGSGVLHHKIEGDRPIYWTGPSLGFDIGGNASKTFVLVYNLYDSQDLYHRFPAAEGTAYLVGGFTASYLRRGDVVLIPVRLGVGWRLGANVGYMKFTQDSRWMPF